jgi:hypothetical protein
LCITAHGKNLGYPITRHGGTIHVTWLDRLTLVTTGRSHTYQTLYGTLEFTHTSKSPEKILDETTLKKETGLLEASENLALRDLKRAGRNENMISDHISKRTSKVNNLDLLDACYYLRQSLFCGLFT